MRTRDSLEHLAIAGRPLVAGADSLLDAAEEDRILEAILTTPHAPARSRRLRPALVLAGAAIIAAAAAVFATGILERGTGRVAKIGGNHNRVALTGPTIRLAGYHFRTPAGFRVSDTSCDPSAGPGPNPAVNGFVAAASADGGCVEAFFMESQSGSPAEHEADPVAVGSRQGYYVPKDASGQSTLYVALPNAAGAGRLVYLALFARQLTEDQLIAVAESGLPTVPLTPTTTTSTETG